MRRWIILLALIAIAVTAFGLWHWQERRQALKTLRDAARQAIDMDMQAGLDVDLSLKGIELSQGKEGQVQWRLKASRARYQQDEGEILVEEPEIEYFFATTGQALTVRSDKGEVNQRKETARLWPAVEAHYDEHVVTAAELNYTGATRELTLSGNVTCTGPRLSFTTPELRYTLTTGAMESTKGVQATILVDNTLGTPLGTKKGAGKR